MYRAVYYFVHVRAGSCARTDILIHPCSAVRVIINHLSQFSFNTYLCTIFDDDDNDDVFVFVADDVNVMMLFSEETQRPAPPWCCL